jgi:hypothetical protein
VLNALSAAACVEREVIYAVGGAVLIKIEGGAGGILRVTQLRGAEGGVSLTRKKYAQKDQRDQ